MTRAAAAPVDDLALVQVVHAPGHLHRHLEGLAELQGPLPPHPVVHAAVRHVLKHDAEVGLAGAGADELDHVLVADLGVDGGWGWG